jgi:hypothetical protein
MKALVYRNTKTTLPNWTPIHSEHPRGMAYETPTHFIHIYGNDLGICVVSPGLRVRLKIHYLERPVWLGAGRAAGWRR